MLTADRPSPTPTWTAGRRGDEGPAVLVVEDSPSDMFLIGRALAGTALSLRCQFSTTISEAVRLAERDVPDIVLLDLSLPDSYGIRTLKRFRSACPLAPIVVVTGHTEIRLAIQALRVGARDYLLKTELSTLEPTLRRVLAEARAEREQQQRDASRTTTLNLDSIGRLGAVVAHEINTPLQFINDNLAFLRRAMQIMTPALDWAPPSSSGPPMLALTGADRATLSYLVEQMPAAIEQALDGVQRIGRVTAALTPQHELSAEPATTLHLSRLLEMSVASCRQHLTPGLQVSTQIEAGLPAITVHEHALRRAFANIIENACEAIARSGELRGNLEICVARRDDRIEVRFTDDGPGIASEHLDSVFDPFFTTKAVGAGAGQGLTFAHQVIARRHGGELTAHSTPGRGATFVATLPLAVPGHVGGS